MIRALAGWMLVQPLNTHASANDQLRLGRVHSIGELPDAEMQAKIPFKAGDRIAWIEGTGPVHVINETLLAVALSAPLVYEPLEDLVVGDGRAIEVEQ
jgi:hypothetical protein